MYTLFYFLLLLLIPLEILICEIKYIFSLIVIILIILTMKRGRKTTIFTEDISRALISHKEQILQNNILIKPTNIIWANLITKYNWNIMPKALWTRIFKYSPNYYMFFECGSKQCKAIYKPIEKDNSIYDELLSNSDHGDSNNENSIKILSIYVSAKSWKEIQRDDGLKNKLKPGV